MRTQNRLYTERGQRIGGEQIFYFRIKVLRKQPLLVHVLHEFFNRFQAGLKAVGPEVLAHDFNGRLQRKNLLPELAEIGLVDQRRILSVARRKISLVKQPVVAMSVLARGHDEEVPEAVLLLPYVAKSHTCLGIPGIEERRTINRRAALQGALLLFVDRLRPD